MKKNTVQPSGQRVEEKISWAKEILSMYGYEVIKSDAIYENPELLGDNQ